MKEDTIIIITMILNFWVAIIKLFTGIMFSFSTLIADSIQSFTDFITDITSLIANRIGKRRANKQYPFGYGQAYCLANIFTGILLFLIGVFILYQFFFFDTHFDPNYKIYIILAIILVLKLIVVLLLQHFGKSFKSELMIESARESGADFISTVVVLGISILVMLQKAIGLTNINIDKIGSLGMAIYVFYTSIKMLISNIQSILTNTDENIEIKNDVEKELHKFKEIEIKNIRMIKMYNYYHVSLKVIPDESLTIKDYIQIEKKIKSRLRNKNKDIRFIDIEPISSYSEKGKAKKGKTTKKESKNVK